jgi:hypothetical protein
VSSVAKAKSDVRTNQKMRFDIDIGGRFLSIGDQVRDFHSQSLVFIATSVGGQHLYLRP